MNWREEALAILDGTYHQQLDRIDRELLMIKAVKVMKANPEIDYNVFAHEVGLTARNDQIGLTGWYMQSARSILERAKEQGYEI